MDAHTRRLLLAMSISMLVMIIWLRVMNALYPPPPPRPAATEVIARTETADREQPLAAASGPASAPSLAAGAGDEPTSQPGYRAFGDPDDTEVSISLGSRDPATTGDKGKFWLGVQLTSRGAALTHAVLTPYRNSVARGRSPAPDPYDLILPWVDPLTGRTAHAFTSATLRLIDAKQDIDLGALNWTARKEQDGDSERAVFEAVIQHDGRPILRIVKTYTLSPGAFDLSLRHDVENLTDSPLAISLTVDGPIRMKHEEIRSDDQFVIVALREAHGVETETHTRHALLKAENRRKDLLGSRPMQWLASVNKWFACIVAPVETEAGLRPAKATAFARTTISDAHDDIQFSVVFTPGETPVLAPRATAAAPLSIYLGPKERRRFEDTPQYAALGYSEVLDAVPQSCSFLTFRPLAAAMRWLLSLLHRVLPGVHNYGFAIVVMVIIVRALLHGLTKRSQIGMMRMQKQMATLQPKIEAVRAKYGNDPAALNRETMQVYREAGINPFGQVMSCLPMFIQMPIWVALWTTLNTSIELRHEPFILWMRDLAAPDAMIRFSGSFYIPLLGAMTGPISSFNLLPIVMGLTMYLQQKLTQKLTKPDKPVPTTPSADGRPSPADQLRQQQKMMNFMTIFFALMFYNFPCGLNLYIFTSNVFGMLEQWWIRKHIHAKDALTPAPRKSAIRSRLASMMERFEKIAEEAKKPSRPSSDDRRTRQRTGRR